MGIVSVRGALIGAVALGLAGCATAAAPPPSELVWPLPPDSPRVKFVETFARLDHFGSDRQGWLTDLVLGPDASKAKRMLKPLSVTTDAKGRVYVTDTGVARVWVFDREKKEVRFLGESGHGLAAPSGVAVDSRGVVFVSDFQMRRVFAIDQNDTVLLSIGKDDELVAPAGLAIDERTKRLYVADTRGHRIRVYDTITGEFKFELAERGNGPAQFNFPTNLFIRKGVLYVGDTGNFRIQALTLDGKFLRKYGELGANFGQLARPKGVAVDSEGHLYVADAAFGNFQIFDTEGELLLFVGNHGAERGQFRLPAGMHIDDQDRIYVVDQFNSRVQVFQYLGKDVELAKAAKQANTR